MLRQMVPNGTIWLPLYRNEARASFNIFSSLASSVSSAYFGLSTIQDLLGHGQITTTQRYCRVANLKVQRDYDKAIELVLARTQSAGG